MHDIRRLMRDVAGDLWRVPQPAPGPGAEEERPENPVTAPEELWKAVDDPVDWTALLASSASDPTLAALAPDVLSGDPAAYRRALDVIRPLVDLTPYMDDCTVSVADADTLIVRYHARFDASDRRRACGIALRAARDLFAALPVFTAHAEAVHQDGMILRTSFTRDDLRRARMTVADPEQLAAENGTWSKE